MAQDKVDTLQQQQPQPIYLDYNATTPLDELVLLEIQRSLKEDWGNPSSAHVYGSKAKAVIEQSRASVARMLNANPEDIVFTSGGTEGNNVAILSVVEAAIERRWGKPHVITSNVEHDSVAHVLRKLEKQEKIELSTVDVSNLTGELNASDVLSLVKNNTCLVSIMHANNETGVIFPIQEIGESLEALNASRVKDGHCRVYFHCDAAQTIGKIKVDVKALKVDLLTVVGHKFYAPRIGALFVKNILHGETPFRHFLEGGGQERGFRPGTENTPMIAGLGKAAELVHENLENYTNVMKQNRDNIALKLQDAIPGSIVNFHQAKERLPNTLSFRLPEGHSANVILNEKCKGMLLASLGAACHSDSEKPSSILSASGLSPAEASRTIRISVGRNTTASEVDTAVKILKEACTHLN